MTGGRWTASARWAARAAMAAALLWLAGCTTYVQTQVTAFSDWSGSDATRTYAFVRMPDQKNSIEQATYEVLVANELATHAFRQVPVDTAQYLVALDYGIQGSTVTVSQPVYYDSWPMYGGFGRPYWGGGWGPWGPWGPGPAAYVDQTYPIFVHSLQIRMTERATGREVYKVGAANSGGENSLIRAMPYLVRSALADFPLGNGTVRTVKIPLTQNAGIANEAPVAAK